VAEEVAEEGAAAEKAAAEKAAAEKAAAEKAAAEKAAAEKAAAEAETAAQGNAGEKAGDYLSFAAFSRSGLIQQLTFEGFTAEQAAYGVGQTGL
jgi:colicin import membrane protein